MQNASQKNVGHGDVNSRAESPNETNPSHVHETLPEDPNNEFATAPTATASDSENPVDQNQVADLDEIVTIHPFESKLDEAEEFAAPKGKAGAVSGNYEEAPSAEQQNERDRVDEDAMPFAKRGPECPRKIITAEAVADKIVKLPLDKLLSHPLNEKLYSATSPDEIKVLAESIAGTGQLSPLVVTADLEKAGFYALLSGHKRADALRSLGRMEANCQVVDVQDADERLLRLLEANLHHDPTTEQKLRIGEVYFELETKKAKARQVAGAKAAKKGGEVVEVLTQPTPPPAETADDTAGKARDHAAAKIGMSGVSFDKGRKVLLAMEKAEAERKTASVARLRELLNKKGIEPAFEHAKALKLIKKASGQGDTGGKTQGNGSAAKGAVAPHEPVPNAVAPENDPSAPTVTETVAVALDDTDTVEVPEQATSVASRPAEKLMEIVDEDEQPPGVRIIALGEKFFEELEGMDVSDLTLDLKRNLRHTLDNIGIWHADHDEMLKLPGEL